MKLPLPKLTKGFTLIELLVAIGILVLLATIAASTFSAVLRDNRDQQRLRDLNSLKQALEMYRSDQGSYPDSTTVQSFITGGSTFTLNGKEYMAKVPNDPLSERTYLYLGLSCSGNPVRCAEFALCAGQEGSKSYELPSCSPQNCSKTSSLSCDMEVDSP